MTRRALDIPPDLQDERRLPMTYERWLAWVGESTQSEWVDGEAIAFMPSSPLHQRVVWLLSFLLGGFARGLGLGEVLSAPLEMRLPHAAGEPDLIFLDRASADRLVGSRLVGPADLVVEVISDDSVGRDRVQKFAEYEAAGVPEYWLVDPRPGRQWAEFYLLSAEGRYERADLDAEGRYHSRSLPGFWLRPEWLWQEPPADPLRLLAAIAPAALRAAMAAENTD